MSNHNDRRNNSTGYQTTGSVTPPEGTEQQQTGDQGEQQGTTQQPQQPEKEGFFKRMKTRVTRKVDDFKVNHPRAARRIKRIGEAFLVGGVGVAGFKLGQHFPKKETEQQTVPEETEQQEQPLAIDEPVPTIEDTEDEDTAVEVEKF